MSKRKVKNNSIIVPEVGGPAIIEENCGNCLSVIGRNVTIKTGYVCTHYVVNDPKPIILAILEFQRNRGKKEVKFSTDNNCFSGCIRHIGGCLELQIVIRQRRSIEHSIEIDKRFLKNFSYALGRG